MAARLSGYRRATAAELAAAGFAPGSRRFVAPSGGTIAYREYRARVEAAGAVERLDVVRLAEQRRKQRAFNDIISQMSKVRARALDNAIENATAAMESARRTGDNDVAAEAAVELQQLKAERRTVKSAALKSPTRKEALGTLKDLGHKKNRTREQELDLRQALTALGRREGIPDWVAVGQSDAFRRGQIRPPRAA